MEVKRFLKFLPLLKTFSRICHALCLLLTIFFFVVWHYLDQGLGEAKASFGIIKLQDGYFDDPNCAAE